MNVRGFGFSLDNKGVLKINLSFYQSFND